ncbi:ATP-binding protein [Protofrankia symbiont of Coriaria ruscifolia]|uniref:ATP-binding protein n=1 Tax=Protofrankia symbiont of Coriaria ruscifolia TaxID=1306542 RepID=UPI00104197ED|nr:ATP-binding protein [Protofrankia symbiont of Coriaria ruscifolia]
MPPVEAQPETVSMLTKGLLFNYKNVKQSRPLPIVVLLGPVGAGKTHTLESIAQTCDIDVINARFDFGHAELDRTEPATTIEVLTRLAFGLSRKWRARPKAQFTRFALGMIAIQTQLNEMSRQQAMDKLEVKINEFLRTRKIETVTTNVATLATTAENSGLIPTPVANVIREILPSLIRTVARRPLNKAKRWHAAALQAMGASPLDALVDLNRLAHDRHDADVTAWLTDAFLADVRDSYPRMARPDPGSPCACDNPEEQRHRHNWLLLLDNLDHEGGGTFITDLLAARKHHLRLHPGEHDPLLVIATSGRWNADWNTEWRPPWLAEPDRPNQAWTVPPSRTATYKRWFNNQTFEHPRSRYYPVLLEPLSINEIARILDTAPRDPKSILAQRATGGLPAAVCSIAPLLRNQEFPPGARNVLGPSDPAAPNADPWRVRLDNMRLNQYLPDIEIENFISAAPFATAPWLVRGDAEDMIFFPHVGRILTELRTALWVTTPAHGGGTPNYAELHPWLARTLVSALAQRNPSQNRPSYTTQFETLLNDPDTLNDPARKSYCHLALRQISEVVSAFEASFDQEPHKEWTSRLRLVVRAPDNLPLDRSCSHLYQRLVNEDALDTPQDRSRLRNTVTRLVVTSWLAANPFAMPDPRQTNIIISTYQELRLLSRRSDIDDLQFS